MSDCGQLTNRVKLRRQEHGWSQAELAQRAGISRAAVSAVEIQRLTPSVAAALALATALGCRVEDLFGPARSDAEPPAWAWPPPHEPCRYWHARVGGRRLLFPVEATAAGVVPHDGVFHGGATIAHDAAPAPEDTLVMASCDPAAGLLANEYARASGFRLLVLYRSSGQALNLLRDGLVDVAGTHLARNDDERNVAIAHAILGTGYSLATAGTWQEGLAVRPDLAGSSIQALLRRRLRWIGRALGCGARQCQDELLQGRPPPRRSASDHRGVAEAIRCGWADVGVCVRLACEEAGLQFLAIRSEAYDLCFRTEQEHDPRLRTLLGVLRSKQFQTCLSELPGYDCRVSGDTIRIE